MLGLDTELVPETAKVKVPTWGGTNVKLAVVPAVTFGTEIVPAPPELLPEGVTVKVLPGVKVPET
jgi:hypothetical protein